MKIVVLSDTHIPLNGKDIPEAMMHDFKDAGMIIHAGDFVETSVLDKLQSICPNVKAVWGNMDPAEIKNKLSEKQIIRVGKFKVGLMHGYGPPDNLVELMSQAFKDERPDIIIFGHSHNALNERKDGILYFNPGSPTDKVYSHYNSYGIIEINDKIEARIIKI